MAFKNKDEYEREKAKWRSNRMRDRSPAGYDRFLRMEGDWLAEQRAERELLKKQKGDSNSSNSHLKTLHEIQVNTKTSEMHKERTVRQEKKHGTT